VTAFTKVEVALVDATAEFLDLAKDRNVFIGAGSDFHGAAVEGDVKLAGISGNEDRLSDLLKEAACLCSLAACQ
jgi:hypothetical protein